jgi:hypothetical protein
MSGWTMAAWCWVVLAFALYLHQFLSLAPLIAAQVGLR